MKLKWYHIALIIIVSLVIGYLIGKANAQAKQNLFKSKITSDLNLVLNQINSDGTSAGRVNPTVRTQLVSRRDALLKIANPSPMSGNILIFDNGKYWNGWTYVNTPLGISKLKCTNAGNYWVFDPTTGTYVCVDSNRNAV